MKQKGTGQKSKPLKNNLDEEIEHLLSQYDKIGDSTNVIKFFRDFPLSQKTIKGLNDAKFIRPTDIQRESIIPALLGKDVLGAAITGSGKTLAFLIPVLEHLYIAKWSRTDGLAAVIISPTRELAYQIFETLKKIGKYHDFSAGLIIGGKNLKFERSRMDQCNLLICTPGRLLQHMDENPLFNASTTEILVLDEADRCLDMGFEHTINAIVENFPQDRQTLLFSATQTNSVKDLARLNLKQPICIGQPKIVDENKTTTKMVPDLLQQSYVVIELADKITMLWSFIKNHLKQKIIVFLSSCKQVKYVYEIFCKLRPGTSLLALYGTLHQDRRIAIYNDFVRKSNVVMFATDIASRGLDFPSVNWVVQLDCPEDVTQYIHRAGRSARNKKRGECLLVLMPSEEEAMINELNEKFINVKKIEIDPKKLFSPRAKIEAFLAQNPELKSSAQRAFIAYIKSVFLMKNKKVFNVLALNFDAYAKSLGLAVTPRVRFVERYMKKQNSNNNHKKWEEEYAESDESGKSKQKVSSEQFQLDQHDFNFKFCDQKTDSEDDDDNFIKIKRANHEIFDNQESDSKYISDQELQPQVLKKKERLVTKAALAKKILKKKLHLNEKVKFDDKGQEIKDSRKLLQSELGKEYESKGSSSSGIDIEMAKKLLQEEDKFDKLRFRQLVKQKHKVLKEKRKKHNESEDDADDQENEPDDVESNDDDDSVNLSWLPGPSTGLIKESNSDLESDESEIDENDFKEPLTKKFKITSKLNLNDAEDIAAKLLANSM